MLICSDAAMCVVSLLFLSSWAESFCWVREFSIFLFLVGLGAGFGVVFKGVES